MNLRLSGQLLPSSSTRASFPSPNLPKFPSIQTLNLLNPNPNLLLSKVISFGIALSFTSQFQSPLPSLAIPFPNSQPQSSSSSSSSSSRLSQPPPTTTPFSQARNMPTGLQNGKIRACPSINPGCISTNPQSSGFDFPWTIPENSVDNAIQELQNAILKTQKNVKIQVVEDTPYGKYLKAEVDDEGFGRDVIEFLVKGDIVSYRAMATKVTYIYPFTTALGDSKGQQQRLKNIIDYLGWYAPILDFNE